MNRVIISVLSQKSNLKKQDIETISQICQARPLQKLWKSEKFAIFPLQIILYLSNPPFNKISLSIPSQFRTRIQIFESKNGKQYFKIEQINEQKDDFDKYPEGGIVSKFFKQSRNYNYLKLKFYIPKQRKGIQNICKQVGIRAIQISNIVYFNAKYLCSLRKRLQLHPAVFRLLEILQYKTIILEKQQPSRLNTQMQQKYIKRMKQIEQMIYKNKINPIHPDLQTISKLNIEFEQFLQQPVLQQQQLDFSNPIELKGRIKRLQKQLGQFYIDRLNNLQPNVKDYFQKYWNQQIRDIYLRLLSSPQQQDKTKALIQFWTEIKQLQSIPPNIQQASLMFFNYFLQFIQISSIKISGIKILCLFLRIQTVGFKLNNVYQRILFNLINCLLAASQKEQIYKLAYKTIFILYKKISNSPFLQEFLNRETHARDMMKLIKLEILQKIILNDQTFSIQNNDKQILLQFLLDIFLIKELNVDQKNKAYNIIAILARQFGKQAVMQNFQKLNSMILMNMQKIIDKKLAHLKNSQQNQESEFRTMCDYCGVHNAAFKDQNFYDIHCFKQCRMLVPCAYCSNIVQIPELHRHYLEECSLKNKFKNCQNCNDVILIQKQPEHNKKCMKNFVTKCPLCEQKLQSKLRIKQHILKDGCPNNQRN